MKILKLFILILAALTFSIIANVAIMQVVSFDATRNPPANNVANPITELPDTQFKGVKGSPEPLNYETQPSQATASLGAGRFHYYDPFRQLLVNDYYFDLKETIESKIAGIVPGTGVLDNKRGGICMGLGTGSGTISNTYESGEESCNATEAEFPYDNTNNKNCAGAEAANNGIPNDGTPENSWRCHAIQDVACPVNDQDAATKQYVDNVVQGLPGCVTP